MSYQTIVIYSDGTINDITIVIYSDVTINDISNNCHIYFNSSLFRLSVNKCTIFILLIGNLLKLSMITSTIGVVVVCIVKYLTMVTWLLSQYDSYELLTVRKAVLLICYFVNQVVSILA